MNDQILIFAFFLISISIGFLWGIWGLIRWPYRTLRNKLPSMPRRIAFKMACSYVNHYMRNNAILGHVCVLHVDTGKVETAAESEDIPVLGLSLPIDLRALMSDVAEHYLQRAMAQTNGNKTKAATLVGLPSYQTLDNWLTKYCQSGGEL